MGPVKDKLQLPDWYKCWSLHADDLRGFVALNRSRWFCWCVATQQTCYGQCESFSNTPSF
jgi:hypothetical protein